MYRLPSNKSPLSLWSIPLIIAIVSLAEQGEMDWKPLVRSLQPVKTMSFELLGVAPLHPDNPVLSHLPPLPRERPQGTTMLGAPMCLLPTPPSPSTPLSRGTSLAHFLQCLNNVLPPQECQEAPWFHLFLNLSCPQHAPALDFLSTLSKGSVNFSPNTLTTMMPGPRRV